MKITIGAEGHHWSRCYTQISQLLLTTYRQRRRPRSANFYPIGCRGSQSSTDNNRIRRLSMTISAINAVLTSPGSDNDNHHDEDEDLDFELDMHHLGSRAPRS